jgi:serine/threonine-protein kinase
VTSSGGDGRPTAGRTLERALEIQAGRLELLKTRAWLAMSGAMSLSAVAMMFLDTRIGFPGVVMGGLTAAWFAVVHRALVTGTWTRMHGWGSFVVEQSVPWLLMLLLAHGVDPFVALYGWGPVMTYCGVLVLSTLKLSRTYSIVTGLAGAGLYVLVSTVFILPLARGRYPDYVDVSVGGQIVRALFMLFATATVALVSHGLKGALGGVARAVRENDLFGKYRLGTLLAQGGMGEVWEATYCPEGGFERPAAVKLVHPHLVREPGFVESFRAEAALGARLVRHHIAQVFDFGRVDDRYFLAMEYVDGMTLSQLLKRSAAAHRRIPDEVVGAIGRSVLSALAFAHDEATAPDGSRLHVIHRDIAPANVLLAKSGTVKLTDFGIAKVLRDGRAAHTETVAGHFDHMAPEQVEAGPLDARTDLFCVGILIWEMLAQRRLFRRDNDAATLRAVLVAPIIARFLAALSTQQAPLTEAEIPTVIT